MSNIIFVVCILSSIGGKIQGIVKDADSGEPIPYANVIVSDMQIGAATDEEGYFFILNVPSGLYQVEVSYIGYQTKITTDVIVEINQTARLDITLKQSPIEVSPVTVIGKTPFVSKDMTGTTYIIRKAEVATIPVDYAIELIAFQPSVARLDTALHVRGGRPTEVLYMIDNVSIIDPQSGDPVISMPKGVINEVIFLPGGYDVEYGRAMSGVVNLITERPRDRLHARTYGKTEAIMPFYYDFGYQNYQASVHLPVSKKSRGFLSFDWMHTNDWTPRLFILPHKQRDDYTFYGKWLFTPSGKWRIALSGAKSRSQFDRYNTQWKFNLNHYRSDFIDGNLQVANFSFLPDSRKVFSIALSRLQAEKVYGVREKGDYGPFEDFVFKDYQTITWPEYSVRNPWGSGLYVLAGIPLSAYPLTYGDYPEYRIRTSDVRGVKFSANIQAHKYHEVKAGFEYLHLDFKNFNHFVANKYLLFGREYQLFDEYHYRPKEYSLYLQDDIDYEGLYAKVGCRFDHFRTGIDGIEPKSVISPRCGASFKVTEKFLFRTNFGLYAQPPLYDQMYSYYNILPLPSHLEEYLSLVGNPHLRPEQTMSYEIGLQGIINENWSTTINVFYKDVSDLIGTRFIPADPQDHVRYQNIEYANIRGIEAIFEVKYPFLTGRISYTLSWARGTSSYAEEVYDIYNWYETYDTITYNAEEYYLNFDQRHRFFLQGAAKLPLQTDLYLYGYLGTGFPYIPPGEEGTTEERNVLRFEFQKQLDCVVSKSFRLGPVAFDIGLEIINVLGTRYQIRTHAPIIDWENIDYTDFYRMYYRRRYDLTSKYYSPSADKNHDGMITAREQYEAFLGLVAESDDWVNAYSAPRRARLGILISL